MYRPYIICHMVTSIDGRVTGGFLSSPECESAVETYYEINRKLKCSGFVCGRVTMEESFTGGYYPDLSKYKPVKYDSVPTDYLPDKDDMTVFYAIAFDPKGRLGWKSNRIVDDDPGYGGAQIIEVLTEQADERYLGYLQEMKIPYFFAGKDEIDVEQALAVLSDRLGISALLLEGGSVINGWFQRAGVVDELSLVVAPVVADGADKPLFTDGKGEGYVLKESKIFDNGVVWLNYKKEK